MLGIATLTQPNYRAASRGLKGKKYILSTYKGIPRPQHLQKSPDEAKCLDPFFEKNVPSRLCLDFKPSSTARFPGRTQGREGSAMESGDVPSLGQVST